METKVRFRFNKRTGEVEFLVDQDSTLPHAEHDLAHDRIAAEIGRVIENLPRVVEVTGDDPVLRSREAAAEPPQSQTDTEETAERDRPAAQKEGGS